ncbi:tetratricopeptide repeat protein [Chthonomonas calidirosea]|uniref:tetratricopeptide repeat-containing glycosyltransferase family protein n=1 Tax=Chthonomonas calidirosea TaxID=454171 RepID=UPI0006EC4AEA|nr:tetratricopeptide repeat-containing glycosyltransferase family protein [Chthonomonas calidirosea]CEK20012.1 tetratricopeptide repeat protein [Chthonomonas calidirosea]
MSWASSEARRLEGDRLQAQGQYEQALACYQQAIALEPANIYALNNMAVLLVEHNGAQDAEELCRRALSMRGDLAELHYNLGRALAKQERFHEAIAAYEHALDLAPNMAEAYNMLGNAWRALGIIDKAERCYRQAVSLKPESAEFRVNRGLTALLQGRYEEGFADFERRFALAAVHLPPLPRGRPWHGEPLRGRTLLVRFEGGFGDTLHFLRYLTPIRAAGARVLLECQPELARLLSWCADADAVISAVRPNPPSEPFDFHVSLLSLPYHLWKTHGSLSQSVPYIKAPPKLERAWREKLTQKSDGLRVGVVWAGNPYYPNDKKRSCPIERFSSLFEVAEAAFYSLQKGGASEYAQPILRQWGVQDLSQELRDFADTAAAIAALDLVISVDTAVAHLAGAMGKPVWVLLPFSPDWRWGMTGGTTVWYPSMRLFRQTQRDDWQGVLEQVADQLRADLKSKDGLRPTSAAP